MAGRWLAAPKAAVLVALALAGAGALAADSGQEAMPELAGNSITAQSMDPRYEEVRLLFLAQERGMDLYRVGDFEGAHKELEAPAANGLKIAQQLMAFMYMRGEGVQKHPAKGVALLGLAAESGDRSVRRQYRKALGAVPDEYRDVVEQQVQFYIERYGMATQGITCKRANRPQSHFMAMDCTKEPGDYPDHPWVP